MIPIPGLISAGLAIFNKFFPGKEEQDKIKIALQELDNQINMGQIEINKQEAAHRSIFVAGWRPFIGWVCGAALAYDFVGRPILMIFHVNAINIDSSLLYPLIMGMLGFGGLRTFEKLKGLTK